MTENNESSREDEDQSPVNRRNFLGGAGIIAVGSTIPTVVDWASGKQSDLYIDGNDPKTKTSHEEYEKEWTSELNKWLRIESTLRCMGGYESVNSWETEYRMFSYGVCRTYDPDSQTPEEGSKSKYINSHQINVTDDTSDGVDGSIWYSEDNSKMGGWPTPEYTALEMAEDGLEDVGKVAMGSLSNTADLILDYKETYENWSQKFNEQESNTDGEAKTFKWLYGDGYWGDFRSDIGNFIVLKYEQPMDSNSSFYINPRMEETADASLGVNWKVTVQSPVADDGDDGSGGGGDDGETTTDDGGGGGCGDSGCLQSYDESMSIGEQMSEAQRKEWGMVKLPVSEAKARGLNIQNPRTVDGNKIWISTTPKVTLEPVER